VNVLTAGYQLIQFDLMECQEMPGLSDNKEVLSISARLCADANSYEPGLEELGRAHDVTLPNTLPDDLLNRYLSLHYQNTNANAQYLNDQIYSHENALAIFEQEVSHGQNQELIGDSRRVIPVVQENLHMLRQAQQSEK
jgi:putative membrane protein